MVYSNPALSSERVRMATSPIKNKSRAFSLRTGSLLNSGTSRRCSFLILGASTTRPIARRYSALLIRPKNWKFSRTSGCASFWCQMSYFSLLVKVRPGTPV